jgi:hypothetical protein
MMKQLAFVLAVACTAPLGSAQAQTELKAYADADGYINVQKLTCAQLAGTYQEVQWPRKEVVHQLAQSSRRHSRIDRLLQGQSRHDDHQGHRRSSEG